MAEFTPTVHRDFVRNALPGMQGRKVANVADGEIEGYIAAAARKVLRRTGEPQNAEDKVEAEYLIKLYAMADTLERSLVEQGVSEVPVATAWRTRADAQLESLDLTTTGEGEDGAASSAANVQNLTDVGIFAPPDFGVDLTGSRAPGSSGRDIWPY